MTLRLAALLIILSCACHCRAFDLLYPGGVGAPEARMDSVAWPLDDFSMHLRADISAGEAWSVVMQPSDSSQVVITLTLESDRHSDDLRGLTLRAEGALYVHGRRDATYFSESLLEMMAQKGQPVSVVIRKCRDEYNVSFGPDQLQEAGSFTLPADSKHLLVGYDGCRKVYRYAVDYTPLQLPRYREGMTTSADIISYLSTSSDPVEGIYRYLDRDNDRVLAIPGGFYTLALVQSEDVPGAYDILYIDGATSAASRWTTGRYKGRLTPGIFIDSYSLEWLDARGRKVEAENSATITQGAILDLSFPLLKTHMRFSRLPEHGGQ